MSDLSGMSPAAPPPAPAQSACGFCRRPIADQYFEFMGKVCCPPCAYDVLKMADRHQPNTAAIIRGALFGIGAAICSGVVWALVADFGHVELGILAVGVGWSVASAIKAGSGGRRGPHMQAMAVIIAILGIVFGKLLIPFIQDCVTQNAGTAIRSVVDQVRFDPSSIFSGFDVIWMFIAILRPFQTFKPLNLRIRGPFSLSAGPVQAMQFDRPQPIAPSTRPGA